jgi:type II secretion system protein G
MGSFNFRRRNSGFFLVEILCLLGIMLILFVVFFRVYVHRNDDIKYHNAREDLSILNCALENYHTLTGEYPPGNLQSMEQNAVSMYSALVKDPNDLLGSHKWKITANKILDPWGHPYIYKFSGKAEEIYILFSMGPNGYIDEHELIDDIYSR